MISKILKIQGVGKFANYSSSGNDDLKFLRNTIIFGYNTYGKSTLTTIFRSLKLSDQRYLQGKKTFNYSGNILIDILNSNNEHLTLSNGKWSNPNIVIFDNHFINNSIFIGDEIDYKHRSSLYGIFVGENIGPKLTALKKLRTDQGMLEKKRDDIKTEYKRLDLSTFDDFLKSNNVNDVDSEIKLKEDEINRLSNIAALKKLISTSPLASDFGNLSVAMQKTLDAHAEKNIEEHIKNNWININASKNFLADGVGLLKDKSANCVFCGQKLEPVINLIKDFKKVFGETYKEIRQEIESIGESFLRLDLDAEMVKFSQFGFKCEDILDKKLLLTNKGLVDKDIQTKFKNLDYIIDCTSKDKPLKIFINEVLKLHPFFEKIKSQEFSSDEKNKLENELKKLQLSKYRYSRDGLSLSSKYTKSVEAIEKKKTEINSLRTEIDEETKDTIDRNQEKINTILKDFLRADFTIEKLTSRSNLSRSDSHFIDYEFAINGCPIPISNRHSQDDIEPLDKPYFGNTLSDSDRRLLAMAFFISNLSTDKNLKDKIVIFDDPFSSFDSNRKDYLSDLIANLKNGAGEIPEQIIVLTHDDGFLARLKEKMSSDDTKILEINYSATGGSKLNVCNTEDLTDEQYFKDIRYIKDSVDNSRNINESLSKVRKCLERVLRHKYYFSLDSETMKSGSITSYLEIIDDKCNVKDEILRNNWHEPMHDQHEIMRLEEPEKVQKLKDFLQLLEKV